MAATNAFPDTVEFEFTIIEAFNEAREAAIASKSKEFLIMPSAMIVSSPLAGYCTLSGLTPPPASSGNLINF